MPSLRELVADKGVGWLSVNIGRKMRGRVHWSSKWPRPLPLSQGRVMKSETFDWKSGKVIHWDLEEIDAERPLDVQCDHLKEDLAQISYRGGIVLDIGWSPSFDPKGRFTITVVKDSDWECPVFRANGRDLPSLKQQISRAIVALA